MVRAILTAEGYEVLQAADGEEALRVLAECLPTKAPCLLLLDMNLPRLDGLGVLAALERQGCSLAVIAMSGEEQMLADARAAGVEHTLLKPFRAGVLLTLVAQHCAKHGH